MRAQTWEAAEGTPRVRVGPGSALLRALVYGLTAAALAWPLAQPAVVAAAAAGACAGGLCAPALSRSRLRLPSGLALFGALAVVLLIIESLVLDLPALAGALGPELLLRVSSGTRWVIGGAVAAAALGFASLRVRALGVLEVGLVVFAGGLLVADHRYGSIHRPFELADPILVRGGDPTLLFLAVGAGAALLMAAVLIHERGTSRLFGHLALLVLFALGAFGLTQHSIPLPGPEAGGLGLRGKPGEGEGQRNRAGGGSSAQDLEFRDQLNNRQQQTPVAVVLFHDDYSPPTGIYYFRQNAFSQFNGRRLVSATRAGVDRDLLPGFAPTAQGPAQVPDAGLDRTTLETTVALLADHTRPFVLESPVSIEPAENPNPDRFRRVYRATSSALTSDFSSLMGVEAGADGWSDTEWDHYLRVPDDPRYAELAQQIVEPLPEELRDDPMLRAWSIRDWLGKEGTYSLRSRHSSADDPTAHFLFGDKTGYCVHFAHAATYLMRALGVPARVATGYMAEEAARQGGSALLLTSGNAHAWPEIYLRDVGWVVVDVQPERALDPPVQPPDADLQRLLGQLARGARVLPADGSPPPETFAQLWRWLSERLQLGLWVLLGGGLALLYVVKLWRAAVPRFAPARRLPRVLYRAQLDRLSEVGLSRRRGESREAFARRLHASLPSLEGLTRVHLADAFGSQSRVEPATLRAQAKALQSELRAHTPVYRRLWGLLIPWSFWGTR